MLVILPMFYSRLSVRFARNDKTLGAFRTFPPTTKVRTKNVKECASGGACWWPKMPIVGLIF